MAKEIRYGTYITSRSLRDQLENWRVKALQKGKTLNDYFIKITGDPYGAMGVFYDSELDEK